MDVVLRDDPSRDFRQRYYLPDQFLWDLAVWPRIDFDGYMKVALSLLPDPPMQVLDVGCGPGLGSKILTERGYEVTGIDYNQRAIEFAKLLVPNATFFSGDARSLDEMTHLHNRFGAAMCIEVIEHIPPEYHARVLEGIGAMLVPAGVLVLAVPSVRTPRNRWHYKHFDADELVRLIEGCGFEVREIVGQHRASLLFSRCAWRLLSNKYYDLCFGRRVVREVFLRWYNTTFNSDKAERFIVRAEKKR